MSDVINVFAIKDPEGKFWKTPSGKSTWGSVGAAKNSWNCHNAIKGWFDYSNGKPTEFYGTYRKWSTHAEGWSVVKVKTYVLQEEV